MKTKIIALSILALMVVLSAPQPVRAAPAYDPITATYQVTFGNAADGTNIKWTDYTFASGAQVAGYAHSAGVDRVDPNGEEISVVWVNVTLPTACKLGDIDAEFRGRNAHIGSDWIGRAVGTVSPDATLYGALNAVTEDVWLSLPTSSGSNTVTDELYVFIEAGHHYQAGPSDGYADLDNIIFDCTFDSGELPTGGGAGGGPYKPISSDDTVSIVDETAYSFITAYDFSNVYAVDSGIIESFSETPDGWRVVLALDDGSTAIYYGLYEVYITENGAFVDAGCLLGITGAASLRRYRPSTFDYVNDLQFEWNDSEDDPVDWSEFPDGSGDNRCADQNQTANCINGNPNLNSKGSGWKLKADGDQINEDGFINLHNDDYISQNLHGLEIGTEYTLTIIGSAAGKAGIQGELDDAIDNENLIEGDFRVQFSLTFSDYTNLPDTSLLKISTKGADVKLDFVCLHTEDIIEAPPQCYFKDTDIAKGEWGLADDATLNQTLGVLDIPAGGSVNQNISLLAWDDIDADYTITIWARLAPLDLLGASESANVSATIDTGSGTEELGSFVVNGYVTFYSYSDTFTIGSAGTWAGLFELTVDSVTQTGDHVQVQTICIEPEGGVWPGVASPEYWQSPSTPKCVQCVIPDSIWEVVAWLDYLICVISNIWWCHLYKLIVQIEKDIYAALGGFGLLMRYFSVLVANFAAWLPKLIQFGAKKITAELAWLGGVWWQKLLALVFGKEILDNLELSKLVIEGLKTIMGDILDSTIVVTKAFAALLKSAVGMYGNIWTAYSSTEVADIGFSSCEVLSETSVLYPICYGLELMDYVIWAFPAMVALTFVIHGIIDFNAARAAWKLFSNFIHRGYDK